MENNFLIYSIFSTPLIHFKLSSHSNYNFNFKNIKNKINKPKDWKNDVYTSFPNILKNDPVLSNNDLVNIKNDITKEINLIFNKLNIPTSYLIEEFWYNIYSKNQSQEEHCHFSDLNKKMPYWSGVYYYKNCSPTIFVRNDNSPLLQNFKKNMNCELKHFYFMTWCPDIKDGDIILFPPYLKHKTNVHNNKNKKITFSFNLFLN